MAVWDTMVLGGAKLDSSNFAVGFEEDFSSLDLNVSDSPGATDGKWKRGFYLSNITGSGAVWGSDSFYGPAQINQEQQFYGDPKYAHPQGYQGLEVNDGVLCMRSRPVDTRNFADQNRARVKGFTEDSGGSQVSFINDLQVPWYGEMLSTYGRFSMSFGETEATLKMPIGGVANAADLREALAVFPAWWLLQDVPYGKGIDGEDTADGSTYMPAKFGLGGVLTEIDIAELFGYERDNVHSTLHYHIDGTETTQSSAHTIQCDFNPAAEYFTAGVHVTPGKIGWYINGTYVLVLDTPDEIALGMRIPTYDPATPWTATGFTNNFQLHPDSNRRYMQFVPILNIARDAKLTRSSVNQSYNGGYEMPAHADTVSMYVKSMHCKPLAVDNPDTHGMTVRGEYIPTLGAGGWVGNA